MKDEKGYLERMKGSMSEKLFFVDKINLTNTIFIDFGCADGTLISQLKKIAGKNTNNIYIGVDKQFYNYLDGIVDYAFENLSQLIDFMDDYFADGRNVVLITSSVLHECSKTEQLAIMNFVKAYCNYWIIRDMYYHVDKNYYDKEFIDNKTDNALSIMETFARIVEKSNPSQLASFLKEQKSINDQNCAEWFMKYPYIENWETEVKENYWNTDWLRIVVNFRKDIIYDYSYRNCFIYNRIQRNYDIRIHCYTHRQMIIKVK